MIDYGNAALYGRGGRNIIKDLLGGISAAQLKRMQAGRLPGGMGGDFVGMTPERLQALASMMQAAPQSMMVGPNGPAPQMFALHHRLGDGLFQQAPNPRSLQVHQILGQGGNPGMHMGHGGPQQLLPGGGSGLPPIGPVGGMPGGHGNPSQLLPGGGSGLPPIGPVGGRPPFPGGTMRFPIMPINPGRQGYPGRRPGLVPPTRGPLQAMLMARALGR